MKSEHLGETVPCEEGMDGPVCVCVSVFRAVCVCSGVDTQSPRFVFNQIYLKYYFNMEKL